VNNARNEPKKCEQNIDAKVNVAALFDEHSKWLKTLNFYIIILA
jgi:hypothetical protein